MPISKDTIEYYATLPKHVNDRRTALTNNISGQGEDISPPEGFHIDLNFKADSLKALDKTMLPSHALFMHMEKLEQAMYEWRYKSAIDAAEEREAVAALKTEIEQALHWFKHHFVGQLYAEIDTHHIQQSLQDEPPIPVNELPSEIESDKEEEAVEENSTEPRVEEPSDEELSVSTVEEVDGDSEDNSFFPWNTTFYQQSNQFIQESIGVWNYLFNSKAMMDDMFQLEANHDVEPPPAPGIDSVSEQPTNVPSEIEVERNDAPQALTPLSRLNNFRSLTESLNSWFASLHTLAGEAFELPAELGNYDGAFLHMQRINAAKEHVTHARQAKWVVEDALQAFAELQTLLANEARQKGAHISIDELPQYVSLYKRIQPFITNIFRLENESEEDTKEEKKASTVYEVLAQWGRAVYKKGLSLAVYLNGDSKQEQKLVDQIPKNLDRDICSLLQGKDASGTVITPSDELANQWLSSLGPLEFFKQVEGEVNPLKTLMLAEQARLERLTGHDWQNIFENKNMAVLAEVLRRIAEETRLDNFSSEQITDKDFGFKHLANQIEIDSLEDVTLATSALQNIEKTRYDMMVLSQIVTLLHDLISENHNLSRSEVDQNVLVKMKNYVALLKVYFSQGEPLQIKKDLVLADVISQFQNFFDNKLPEASLLTDHFIEQLEVISEFLTGSSSADDADRVVGQFETFDSLSTEVEDMLKQTYEEQLAADDLLQGQTSYSFQTMETSQAFINDNHTIKAEIEATLAALSADMFTDIQAQTHTQIQRDVANFLKHIPEDNIAPKDMFKVVYFLFTKLNQLGEQLLALSNAPQKAAFYQETIDTLQKELSEINNTLITISKLHPATALLIEQLKHYCYVLKGAFPGHFAEEVAKQEVVEQLPENHQALFGELPSHWQQAMNKFEYALSPKAQLIELLDVFQEGMVNVRQLQAWDETTMAQALMVHWYDDIVELRYIELKSKDKPVNLFHEYLRAADLEDQMELLINDIGSIDDKAQLCELVLSEGSRYVLEQFHDKYNKSAFDLFWQSTVPNMFSALATFEVENYLSVDSTTEKVFECISQLQRDIVASKCCTGISKEVQYQLFHDEYFSLTVKNKLETELAAPREQKKQQAEDEHQQLSKFLEALNKLKKFPIVNPPGLNSSIEQFMAPLPAEASPAKYLNAQREVQILFNQIQPKQNNLDSRITEDYLSDLSLLRDRTLLLIKVTEKAIKQAQTKIDLQQDSLSLARTTSQFYQDKNTQFLANETLPADQVNQRKLKKALLEMMATRMIAESYTAYYNEEQGTIHFDGPETKEGHIAQNIPLFYHPEPNAKKEKGQTLESHQFDAKQKFVNTFNAEMEKIKQELINREDLFNKPVSKAKNIMEKQLADSFKEYKGNSFYYKQLHTIKSTIEEFRNYLENPQLFTENDTSIERKLEYLLEIEKYLVTPCTDDKEGITAGSMGDIKQRFEYIRTLLVPGWTMGQKLDECDHLNNAQHRLRKDKRPNFFVYSETLAFFGYWFTYCFRVFKGVFGTSNDTTVKEKLTSRLFKIVLETVPEDSPSLAGVVDEQDEELDSHVRMISRLGATRDNSVSDGLEEEVNHAAEVQNSPQGWGFVRTITDLCYSATNWSIFQPPAQAQQQENQEEEVVQVKL